MKKTSTICSKVNEHHTPSEAASQSIIKRGSIMSHKESPQSDLFSKEPLNSFHRPPMIHTHVDYDRLLEEDRRREEEKGE